MLKFLGKQKSNLSEILRYMNRKNILQHYEMLLKKKNLNKMDSGDNSTFELFER